MIFENSIVKINLRTGIELRINFHPRLHVVDVNEGSGPEIAGLNEQHLQAWGKDSKLLREALHGSYMGKVNSNDLNSDQESPGKECRTFECELGRTISGRTRVRTICLSEYHAVLHEENHANKTYCHPACDPMKSRVPVPLARSFGRIARVMLSGPWKLVLKTSSRSLCLEKNVSRECQHEEMVHAYVISSKAPLRI